MTLEEAYSRETIKLAGERNWFRELPISENWKGLFFELGATRGFRNIIQFREHMIEIAENETESVLLLTEDKRIGLEKLHLVATRMGNQCQADYYKKVKAKGVKHDETEAIWNRCIEGQIPNTLF